MNRSFPLLLTLAFVAAGCAPDAANQATPESVSPVEITAGNGTLNQINTADMKRVGSTLVISDVTVAQDSFLVLHPFKDGAPVREDYVGSTFVSAGQSSDVMVRLDSEPEAGTPFIIMLHQDVNGDGAFQFGDGVTVPDAPVIEGSTMVALPMQTPEATPVTRDIIANSGREQLEKADAYRERMPYRDAEDAAAMALIHDYLYAVEGPANPTVEQLAPLFADEFLVNFSSGPITSVEEFEAWAAYARGTFNPTRHDLHDVVMTDLEDGLKRVEMEMSWDGLRADGGRMTARTRHDWQIEIGNDGTARIKQIDVEILEPFRAAEWGTL